MAKLLLYVLNNGGKVYYTDTDSIVTDIELPSNIIHPKEIGKLKLEHIVTEGYFIADKTYTIRTKDGTIIKKAKGVDSDSLDFEDYKKMYNMDIIDHATKTSSFRNYSLGSVTINKKEGINLNPHYYAKRKRVFSSTPFQWIGTKVIKINDIKS